MTSPQAVPSLFLLAGALYSAIVLCLIITQNRRFRFAPKSTRHGERARFHCVLVVSLLGLLALADGALDIAAWCHVRLVTTASRAFIGETVVAIFLKYSLSFATLYLFVICTPKHKPYRLYRICILVSFISFNFLSVLAALLPIPFVIAPILALLAQFLLAPLPLYILAKGRRAGRSVCAGRSPFMPIVSLWRSLPQLLLLTQIASFVSAILFLAKVGSCIPVDGRSLSSIHEWVTSAEVARLSTFRALESLSTLVALLAIQRSYHLYCRTSAVSAIPSVAHDAIPDLLDLDDPFAPSVPPHNRSCSILSVQPIPTPYFYPFQSDVHEYPIPISILPPLKGSSPRITKGQESSQSLIPSSSTSPTIISSYPPSPSTLSFPQLPYGADDAKMAKSCAEDMGFDLAEAMLSQVLLQVLDEGERPETGEDAGMSDGIPGDGEGGDLEGDVRVSEDLTDVLDLAFSGGPSGPSTDIAPDQGNDNEK